MTSRRRLLQALAGGSLAALLRQAAAAGHPVAAGLRRIDGDVTLNARPARLGQLVLPGDTLITAPGAQAVYVIGDDAFLQRGASTVSFGDAASGLLRVVTGRILSVFGSGSKRLVIPTATIGIRGTACYIEHVGDRSYFCLCYGEAEIVPQAAPDERVIIRTRHHDHPIYIHGDAGMPTSMVPADVINHTDAELTLLEALVGRQPPFSGDNPY